MKVHIRPVSSDGTTRAYIVLGEVETGFMRRPEGDPERVNTEQRIMQKAVNIMVDHSQQSVQVWGADKLGGGMTAEVFNEGNVLQ